MIKKYLLPCLFVFLGVFVFFAARIGYVQVKNIFTPQFKPQTIITKLNPPKDTISATVTNIKGTVKKQGRDDTEFKTINANTTLLQGESLATENGTAFIAFDSSIAAVLNTYTQLDFLNAQPNQLVIRQPSGGVSYATNQITSPFSVRSLGLLIQFSSKTKAIITTNPTTLHVIVDVTSGEVTLAYSDNNNNTQVQKISSGQRVLFNYSNNILSNY